MTPDQERYLQKTRWLRPFTRWAASFSLATQAWLPAAVRNAPLKLVQRLLRRYHENRSTAGACKH